MPDQTGVRECSIARTLQLVGEKWTLLAIREIMLGNRRFEEIRQYTGAPRDILTARLRKLESDGLVTRSEYQQRPPRYEYQLTERGWSLAPVLVVLRAWGDSHLALPGGPPMVFEHRCGATLVPAVACSDCGEPLRPGETWPREEAPTRRHDQEAPAVGSSD